MANIDAGTLVWKITGDNSGLKSSLKQSETAAKTTAGVFQKIGQTILTALPFLALFQLGKSFAKAASDAQETGQKFSVVFSGIQVEATKTANRLASAFALSNKESKDLLSNTANILQSFGLGGKESLKFSENIVALSADLISFTNNAMGVSGATDAIVKSFLGEAEQLKSLGKVVYIDQLKELAKQQGKNYDQMTKSEKAYFTFAEIVRQSKNEIGDFARSFDSPANTMRAVNSRLEDMKTAAGVALTVPLAELGRAFLDASNKGGFLAKTVGIITGAVGYALLGFSNFIKLTNLALKSWGGEALKKRQEEAQQAYYAEVGQQEAFIEKWLAKNNYFNDAKLKAETDNVKRLNKIKSGMYDTSKALYSKNAIRFLNERKESLDKLKTAQGEYNDNLREQEIIGERLVNSNKKLEDQINANSDASVKNSGDEKKRLDEKKEKTDAQIKAEIELMNLEAQASGKALEQAKAENNALLETWKLKLKNQEVDQEQFDRAKKAIESIGQIKAVQAAISEVQRYGQAVVGELNGLFSAITALQNAQTQNLLDNLEIQKQAEYEKSGVIVETAKTTAQKEYDEAVASGDAQIIADKKMALDKAKIDEEYAKKKAQIEYQAATQAWELQMAAASVQMAMAMLSALASGMQFGVAAVVMAPVLVALAAVTGGIQLAALAAAKPKPPAMATGGIIPGSAQGTQIIAGENNKAEAILNQSQMKRMLDIADGKQSSGQGVLYRVAEFSKQVFYDELFTASKEGRLFIADRAVQPT